MPEVKQHGRRRATVSVAVAPSSVQGTRRAAIAAERANATSSNSLSALVRSGIANGAGQKVGLALAVTGLALAVTVPSATTTSSPNLEVASATASLGKTQAITADSNVSMTFAAPDLGGAMSLDDRLTQTLQVNASKVSAEAAKGTLSAPLKVMNKSSPFGGRVNPLTGALGEVHEGEDFAVGCGTDVFAAAEGKVTFAAWHTYGGGNRVVIDHGNGLSTTYNHLTSSSVKVGQKVTRGELIAQSGTTGNSTGCHLHFEVVVDDEKVDPEGWL